MVPTLVYLHQVSIQVFHGILQQKKRENTSWLSSNSRWKKSIIVMSLSPLEISLSGSGHYININARTQWPQLTDHHLYWPIRKFHNTLLYHKLLSYHPNVSLFFWVQNTLQTRESQSINFRITHWSIEDRFWIKFVVKSSRSLLICEWYNTGVDRSLVLVLFQTGME